MKETKGRIWLITLVASVALLAGTAYWGYTQYKQKQQLLTYMNNDNQKSFLQLVNHVENIEVLLAKAEASGSLNKRSLLLTDLWQKSYFAQDDLSSLPISQFERDRTATFLSQMGDFAFTLAKRQVFNKSITEKDIDKIEELHREAGFLSAELQKIRARAYDGNLTWEEIRDQASKIDKKQISTYGEGFLNINNEMREFPTLTYDGPFSDHIEQRKPKGVTGKNITKEKAKEIAEKFLEEGNKPEFRVTNVQKVDAKIPAYRVVFEPLAGTGPTAVVDVSRKGGHIIMMSVNRDSGTPTVRLKDAQAKAKKFLEENNFKNMISTYSVVQADSAVICYAYQQGGVVVYSDLIKVKVALDNGDIIGMEGLGFLMSHHKRELPDPKLTMEEARKKVNPKLKIGESRLSVIPTETLEEVLAYEFKGEINNDPFIIYINARNGEEEEVLKIIETKDGQLTM